MSAFAINQPYSSTAQSHKHIVDASLSFDGKRLIVLFADGRGYQVERKILPFDDGSPIVNIEIFDHAHAIAVRQVSGNYYDMPWDSIQHYASGKKRQKIAVGKQIQQWRKKQGKSQQEVADAAGISRAQLNRIEMSRCEPSLDTLMKVAQALGVSVADLVSK